MPKVVTTDRWLEPRAGPFVSSSPLQLARPGGVVHGALPAPAPHSSLGRWPYCCPRSQKGRLRPGKEEALQGHADLTRPQVPRAQVLQAPSAREPTWGPATAGATAEAGFPGVQEPVRTGCDPPGPWYITREPHASPPREAHPSRRRSCAPTRCLLLWVEAQPQRSRGERAEACLVR